MKDRIPTVLLHILASKARTPRGFEHVLECEGMRIEALLPVRDRPRAERIVVSEGEARGWVIYEDGQWKQQ